MYEPPSQSCMWEKTIVHEFYNIDNKELVTMMILVSYPHSEEEIMQCRDGGRSSCRGKHMHGK